MVVDCHAEILSRRALIRYFYDQLERCKRKKESVFEPAAAARKYRLKDGLSFHLYVSTSPCGDSAVFGGEGNAHSNKGKARLKVDAGMGGPLASSYASEEEDDAQDAPKRFVVMSCSDKIARWNYLGVQGSLLSAFLKPIYLSSVTIGDKFNSEHSSRALYERLEGIEECRPYSLHRPALDTVRHIELPERSYSTPVCAANWTIGDAAFEILQCSTGKRRDGKVSQVCKRELFRRFKVATHLMEAALYERTKRERTPGYQEASSTFTRHFGECSGPWLSNAERHRLDCFRL